MAGPCCEELWMEWVVVCMVQAKPDWTLFTQRAPGVPTVPPWGSRVTAGARTFTDLLFLPSVNRVVQRTVFSETVILMAGLEGEGKQGDLHELITDRLIDWLTAYLQSAFFLRSFPHVMHTHTQQYIYSQSRSLIAEMLYCHRLYYRCRGPQRLHQLHTLCSDHIQSHILNQSGTAMTGPNAVYVICMNTAVAERKVSFHE